MLLDLIEVAESHTGVTLGRTFVNVLENFGVDDKVSMLSSCQTTSLTVTCIADTQYHR